jgi:hypothetical protein
VHEDDQVEPVASAGLDQQGDVVHHDDVRVDRRGGGLALGGQPVDHRVHDRVQPCAGIGVAEDDGAQRGPVEAAVGGEHRRAEVLHDRGEAGRADGDGLAGQHVVVDQHGSALREAVRRHRLACRDPAGQSDALHRSILPRPVAHVTCAARRGHRAARPTLRARARRPSARVRRAPVSGRRSPARAGGP